MKFLHLFRHQRSRERKDVYVVGRVVAGYVDGVKQVIGVADTIDEAYGICIDYIVQQFGGDYEYQITKWDDYCNIKIIFYSGIIRSHTFRIETHELRKGR